MRVRFAKITVLGGGVLIRWAGYAVGRGSRRRVRIGASDRSLMAVPGVAAIAGTSFLCYTFKVMMLNV